MRKFILSILTLFCYLGYAQNQDVNVWTSLKISQDIDKKASFSLRQGLRYDDNISNLYNNFSQFKGSYDIKKSLQFSVAYRWSQKQSWQKELKSENRYQIGLRYKYEIQKFEVKCDLIFQSKYVNYHNSEYGYIPKNLIRDKFSIEYAISKKIKPYVEFEMFYPIDIYESYVNKLRYQVGSNFKITKSFSTDVYFLLQKEINWNYPFRTYIMGVSLSYDLPKIKTKKKKKNKDKDKKTKDSDSSAN